MTDLRYQSTVIQLRMNMPIIYEVSELDYLIYNEPISYVRLLLSGKMEEYLRNSTDYTPLSEMR